MQTNIPTAEQVHATGTFSGSGQFSKVYILPGNKAVKVCNLAHTDGGLLWALWCIKQHMDDNAFTFLPRYDGIRIDLESNSYVAVMEALDEAPQYYEEGWDTYKEMYDELIDDMYLEVNELQDTVDYDLYEDFYETHNIMMRGKSLVLSDPLTVPGWSDRRYDLTDTHFIELVLKFIDDNPELYDVVEVTGERSAYLSAEDYDDEDEDEEDY